MQHAAYLVIWLCGLFGLIGVVLAGVARLVRKDTVDYDRRFLWLEHHLREPEESGTEEKEGK